jgi:recombinational DNA repair protein (RecF pathway)
MPYTIPMQEYVTNALVLRKDSLGDLDGRYTLFTERFGKISAKAKSSRKITSKLAPHLEPGMVSKVRVLETKGTQLIDALKSDRLPASMNSLYVLSQLLPDGEPEPELWAMIAENNLIWKKILSVLGWDPEGAMCAVCGIRPGEYFYTPRQEFYCSICASKARRDAVIFIDAAF